MGLLMRLPQMLTQAMMMAMCVLVLLWHRLDVEGLLHTAVAGLVVVGLVVVGLLLRHTEWHTAVAGLVVVVENVGCTKSISSLLCLPGSDLSFPRTPHAAWADTWRNPRNLGTRTTSFEQKWLITYSRSQTHDAEDGPTETQTHDAEDGPTEKLKHKLANTWC